MWRHELRGEDYTNRGEWSWIKVRRDSRETRTRRRGGAEEELPTERKKRKGKDKKEGEELGENLRNYDMTINQNVKSSLNLVLPFPGIPACWSSSILG